MNGLPHGVIQVERPDGAISTYEVREGVRHGKETYRNDEWGAIYNTTWKSNQNGGSDMMSAKEATNENAFYDEDGNINTAGDSNWADYM